MTKFKGRKWVCGLFLLCASTAIASHAQTVTTLFSFDGNNGDGPIASLVQGLDGKFYGTTIFGGTFGNGGNGTVFNITANGMETVLRSFNYLQPYGGLVLATDGNFYETSIKGGAHGRGAVFKITPAGKLTLLYNFCPRPRCRDGEGPEGGLVQGFDGDFYGTTGSGGAKLDGTVFKITPNGTLTTLYSFCTQTNCADGSIPVATLLQATDGSFYGTTFLGGYGAGTVFKISPNGTLKTLYSFCTLAKCADGASPVAGLVQGTDGNFYGTTPYGGAHAWGTVFRLTPSAKLTVLYSFCALTHCDDGAKPNAALVQATDGNFYGTTSIDGTAPYGEGTIFKITPAGTLTTLYIFCSPFNCSGGSTPHAALLQATDGNFYGTASNGGVYQYGTVFSLSVGLGPFVRALPFAGKLGETIKILGQGLTGATAVSFNGIPATFTVRSDTYLTAKVPRGATTGYISVTTPSGTLTSNVPFQVIP